MENLPCQDCGLAYEVPHYYCCLGCRHWSNAPFRDCPKCGRTRLRARLEQPPTDAGPLVSELRTMPLDQVREYFERGAWPVTTSVWDLMREREVGLREQLEQVRVVLSSRAACPDHAGNCCASWCSHCRAGVSWERRADDVLTR